MIQDKKGKGMRYLSVIQTQTWLYKFVELCEKQSGRGSSSMQCDIICNPLMEIFPEVNPEVLQYELLSQGLFEPDEWGNLKNSVKEMERKKFWEELLKLEKGITK